MKLLWRGTGKLRFVFTFLILVLGSFPIANGAEQPNIVWIVSEDNSTHYLDLFGEHGAPTPNIDRLADHGVTFDRAFCNSPVCSVARTTLITGVHAPRLGTQYHRPSRHAQLPDGWRMFPAFLRDAGYYTTNNNKKDYNAKEGSKVWDASSKQATWQNRPSKDTPFFHFQSYGHSHESALHFPEKRVGDGNTKTDPGSVDVFPYHPDTEIFRYTYARYHDRIMKIDDLVGRMVQNLRDAGELENTFIFYFGDHGGVLPRSKGYLYETGLHVPLVVRIPENFRDLVDRQPGTRTNGFVSFVDFGPTLLNLAGVDVPDYMDGKSFLGPDVDADEVDERNTAFGYADRFDEKYEMVRTLREGRYKYHRNYQGYYPDGLQNNYRYKMAAFRQWRQLYRDDKLNDVQSRFFRSKPAEALYDLSEDPHEVNNLAGDPEHADVLKRLREKLHEKVTTLPDLSFYPESEMVRRAMDDPISFGQEHRDEIVNLADVADLQTLPFPEVREKLEEAIASDNPWVRYWAMTDCAVFGEEAKPLADAGETLLNDENPLVRVRAAEFVGRIGTADPRPTLMEVLGEAKDPVVSLMALNAVVYLRDGPPDYQFDIGPDDVNAKNGHVKRRIQYLKK